MDGNLASFTDVFGDADEIANSQPLSLPSSHKSEGTVRLQVENISTARPAKHTGQHGDFRSVEEIDPRYRHIFTYPYFNLVQSSVIEDALYSDKSMVVCAPTGSGKTVVFEMAIIHLLMELDDKNYTGDFKIIYMAPVKALCSERLSEWYPKFTKLGLMCIEVTGDTDVDFSQLKPYRIIVTTPEKWDMLTRRWRDHRGLVDVIKLFLIDEVHILNDETRGPVLEAVVSRMKTIEESQQAAHRIEELQKLYHENSEPLDSMAAVASLAASMPRIRFVAVSATVSNPEDVAAWLGTNDKPAVYYKFGDECRPVKLKRVVEGYPCPEGMSIFKFDIILNYKLWPVIQKYHDGKPTLIFCNTRKSVALTAEALSKELTINFTPEQKARLTALASTIKNKKLQALVLNGVGCHHAGLLYEERLHIEEAFRNRDLPILITTTTLAMGVNLPAHLVIIKCTQQYVNGQYQEYSISTVLQMIGRAGRPQFDTEATAVIMTRLADKPRYQALVGGDEPLQSYLHKRLPENLNSEAALGTVGDVAQCVQWLRSTFLSVRAVKDPRRYLGLPANAPQPLIYKKVEELCVKAMNGLASAGLITMDEASCIHSTEAGKLMSVFYLDLETMKQIMKIEGTETLEQLLWIICESHELSDMHLRVDERRTLNALNRNNAAATIRFPMKGKINTRQMKLNCIMQAVFGCLPISEPSLHQEAMKVMRIADRICKCLVAYVTRPDLISTQPKYFSTVLNSIILAKCVSAHLWENSPYVSKQLKGIGPTFSTLLASAGKVNFTLLEESHPRDLERIMNKGAPAGNVLRKQVGLLPKYQLTATPLDERRVSVTLMLINQSYLAENRDQLTASDAHKCYIVAGDSENHLLFFSSFKDKDLISVYDGIITLEITRKHRFEHNIFVHCVSSSWVGLDVKCDYAFKSLEPTFVRAEAIHPMPVEDTRRKSKKQTSITDTFKERKRKTNESDITQCKEKKKRETSLMEKFKVLKNSFEETSKVLKEDLDKSAQMSNQLIHDITNGDVWSNSNPSIEAAMVDLTEDFPEMQSTTVEHAKNLMATKEYTRQDMEELNDEDTLLVDDHIDSKLNEIETEIGKTKTASNLTNGEQSTCLTHSLNNNKIQSASNFFPKLDMYKKSANKGMKRKTKYNRSNFSCIDTIEKNAHSSQKDDDKIPQEDGGFSDTIKKHIQFFLQQTTNKNSHTDIGIRELLKPVESIHCDTRKEQKPIEIGTIHTGIENIPRSQHLLPTGQSLNQNNADTDAELNVKPLLELPPVDLKSHETMTAAQNKINTIPLLRTPFTISDDSVNTTAEVNNKSLHPELSFNERNENSDDGVNIKEHGLEVPTAGIEFNETYLNTSAGVNNTLQSPKLPPVCLDYHKTDTQTTFGTNTKETPDPEIPTFDPKLNENCDKQTTQGTIKNKPQVLEPPPVILISNESLSIDILSPPPEYKDGYTDNVQINKPVSIVCEVTNSNENNVIKDLSFITNNNTECLKTKSNGNYHEKKMVIVSEKEKSTNMQDSHCNTVDKISQSVLVEDDSESNDEEENLIKDIMFADKKMEINGCKTICKVCKDDIVTDKEFKDHFDEDTEGVSKIIRRIKDYKSKKFRDPPIQTQTKTPIQEISVMPRTSSNLVTVPGTGTRIPLVDVISPQPNTRAQIKAETFKIPSFKPPLKQVEMEKTIKNLKIVDGSQENINTFNDNGDYTKKERNTPRGIPATSGSNPAVNSSQQSSASSSLIEQKHKKEFQYKNRYSFSATKIDVCTKNLPDHHIQIIRKVQLDLDVTEIISKVDNMAGKENKQEHLNRRTQLPCYEIQNSDSEAAPMKVNFENFNTIKFIDELGKYLTPTDFDYKKLNRENQSISERNYIHGQSSSISCHKNSIQNHSIELNLNEKQKKIEDTIKCSNRNNTTFSCLDQMKRDSLNALPSAIHNIEVFSKTKSIKDSMEDLVTANFNDKGLRRENCCSTTGSEGHNKRLGLPYHKNGNQHHKVEQSVQSQCKNEINKNKNERGTDNLSNVGNGNQKMMETLVTEVISPEDLYPDQNSEDANTKTGTDSEIENILQKYSVKIRKNRNVLNNTDVKQISQINATKENTMKTKHPFKINDIYNVEIPLPKTLISAEAKRIPRLCNTDIFSRIKDIGPEEETSKTVSIGNESAYGFKEYFSRSSEKTDNIFIPRNIVDITGQSKMENIDPPKKESKHCLNDMRNDLPEEFSEYLSPLEDIPELETQEDYNLDQSMLNPKTLLQQCFPKHDEIIIPPPLDFCDDDNKSDYSPTKIVEDNECVNFPYQEFNDTGEDFTSDIRGRNIFEDTTHAVLTPSKEIETWTFSQESEEERPRFQICKNNSVTSRTVMRSVSPAAENLYLALANRRGKLGQFKFTHKKKFKL